MGDKDMPFEDNTNESNSRKELSEDEMLKIMEERDKLFNEMNEYEKKLMRGLMRGFGNTMILWLISQNREHGYEIMTKLHESTPYANKMPSTSKIYPVLHDLEKNRLIEGSWEYQGKRKIKYYQITEEGQKTLSRFKKMAQIAKDHKSNLWSDFIRDMIINKDK
ncbi:MAG: PadR family transcriptional regulator [Methanobacterium sp.]